MRYIWSSCLFLIFLCEPVVPKSNCTKHLHYLASSQKDFVYCSTVHAVPVTLCLSCEEHYTNMTTAYEELSNMNCSMYFDKDRINIVRTTQEILTGLWTKAYCEDCFASNNLEAFNNMTDNLNTCFDDSIGTKTNVCVMCLMQYENLNDFYVNLTDHYKVGKICYDIQDKMNRTREKWSTELHCWHREFNKTLFIVCSSLVALLPLIFYGGAIILTHRRERNHGVLNSDAEFEVSNESQSPPVSSSAVVT